MSALLDQKQEDNILLSNNLRKLIQVNKINETELARLTHIPQPTIHKITSGKTQNPRIATLKILSDYFNVSIDDLYTGDITQQKHTPGSITVPTLKWDSFSDKSFRLTSLSVSNWETWVIADHIDMPATLYALTTKPSMQPRFPLGTTLIIDKNLPPRDGDLALINFENAPELALRELVTDGPNQLFYPVNNDTPGETLSKNDRILGVVIQSRFVHHEN